MASRGSVFWVLSVLTLCSKFVEGTAFEARFGWDGLEILSTTPESTHTADQLPAFDESLFEWETLTSKDGKSFRVGREKTHCVKGDAIKKAPGQNQFQRDVNWPVGGGWKHQSDAIADKTGISYVKIFDSGYGHVYRYNFQFITTDSYDYYFYDEAGDDYHVNTLRTGKHSFDYNSDKPTIVKVTGI